MTDGGSPPSVPAPRRTALGLRLALAFISVALAAVALVAGLTAGFAAADVSALATRQHAELTKAIAVAAGAAWDKNDSWAAADLAPVLDLAGQVGADVRIRDRQGSVVSASPGFITQSSGPATGAPIVVRGERAGQADVRFTGSGLASADHALRTALLRAIFGAAGLAALLALLTGLAMARRITRPVERIIAVTRRMASGQRAVRVGPITGPGEVRELAAAFDQMADTMDRQEQLRRDLVADVAHELRTPVAVLQANTEALLDGVVAHTPEQTASLHEEALRLGRMVGDLQTLAAAEAAALQLSLAECDLDPVAAEAAEEWEASFAAAGIRFDWRLEPTPVLADPGRVHQVIANLLSNALKFTPSGGAVQMTLSAVGGTARLEVIDSGPGIAPGDQPHVFDRLWRGPGAADTVGSGIGLAVAAELARAHRGSIEVASEPGKGSRFSLILPLAEAAS